MIKNFTMVAEIGCVHIGDVNRAKMLAKLAKDAGADVVKFQKRCPRESVPKEWWDRPHPNSHYAYGKTYLEHRENLELNIEQHAEIKEYCEEIGIEYSTSVWDLTSAQEVIELKPAFIKIPSAMNHNMELLTYVRDHARSEIHISLGMTTKKEREDLMDWIWDSATEWLGRFTVYHCVSGYPVPFEKLFLRDIDPIFHRSWHDKNGSRSEFQRFGVGFSNHGYGIAMEPVAYALGARFFERHFIDDRTFRHTDAPTSLEPQGLATLIRNLKATYDAFYYKPENLIDLEAIQRQKLRGSI